ncbi:MAG: hypothetical protein IPM77_02710 [Crocinitomicaceae bacterium]|nr:hypothetical protein [Crocinitomicaceae bacterium]
MTVVFGTNIFFYSVFDQTVTHVYNFFLCNLLVYLLLRLRDSFDSTTLIFFFAVLSLVGIIRPTNILVIGVLFFFVPDLTFWKAFIHYSTRFKNAWKIFVVSLSIIVIPIVLWKLQTGNWIVYSYGKEVFYFDDPHIIEFLFSYTKGWFVYTPVMLFILVFGFWLLLRNDKPRFLIGLSFFGITVYIFSCWWCWYYGAGMSQRVMIDFYIIPGYLLALILTQIQSSAFGRNMVYTVLVLLMFLMLLRRIRLNWAYCAGVHPQKKNIGPTFFN